MNMNDFTKGMRLVSTEDLGERVICDAHCGKEYTHSDESGGFIFGSTAYCPSCAKEALPKIIGYGEEEHIKARCPEGMSFKDFVNNYRGENNKVKIYEEIK